MATTIIEQKNSLKINNQGRINKKSWTIAKKNFLEKMKNWQSMVWSIGFPIMMLIVYKFVFSQQEEGGGENSI